MIYKIRTLRFVDYLGADYFFYFFILVFRLYDVLPQVALFLYLLDVWLALFPYPTTPLLINQAAALAALLLDMYVIFIRRAERV